MKLFLVAALSLLALSSAGAPAKRCFTKSTKCCFGFSQCGTSVKKSTSTKDCSFKECKNVCAPVCTRTCTVVKTKVCGGKGGKGAKGRKGRGGGKGGCTIVKKRECKRTCEKKCATKCHIIKATCTTVTTTVFPKFCATLSCGATTTSGSSAKPAPFVGTKAISTSTSKPVRKIIGKAGGSKRRGH